MPFSMAKIKWQIKSTVEYRTFIWNSINFRFVSIFFFIFLISLNICSPPLLHITLSLCLCLFFFDIQLSTFEWNDPECFGTLHKKWQHFRRELVNLSTLFVPWQLRIKEIESHFGSVVASYFTFLRWLFWVNIVLAFTLSTFVILPEVSFVFISSSLIQVKSMLMKSRSSYIFN